MKKVILTLSIILSIGSLANAGYCRLGKASLIPLDKDKKIYELSCDDQDIICYETDPGGNTHPGSKIIVHFGEIKLDTFSSKTLTILNSS